jgi:glycolate oxidase
MLEILEDEIRRCLGLLGVKSYAELDASYVEPCVPIARPTWLDSAFPLLAEGYSA